MCDLRIVELEKLLPKIGPKFLDLYASIYGTSKLQNSFCEPLGARTIKRRSQVYRGRAMRVCDVKTLQKSVKKGYKISKYA